MLWKRMILAILKFSIDYCIQRSRVPSYQDRIVLALLLAA